MDLKEHFGSQHGIGILSTAGAEGRVDAAVYFRRHLTVEEDQAKGPKFLVTFAVEKTLPPIGAGQG